MNVFRNVVDLKGTYGGKKGKTLREKMGEKGLEHRW